MGLLNAVFSIYGWIVWVLHLLVAGPILIVAVSLSPPKAFGLIKLFCRSALALTGIRVRVQGLEHVEPGRQYLFMGNHPSMLDPFILAIAVPRFAVGIEKAANFKIPIYGRLVSRFGNIPIHKDDPVRSREAIATAIDRFRQGVSIVILPEGTRSKDGGLGPFKKGGFHLAVDTGATILPITIMGAYQVFRTGGWRMRPGLVEVVFGEPLSAEGKTREDLDSLLAETRRRIEGPILAAAQPVITA
ncbi:1-acyl-sn-glycerol-3-phosphate acyltransferase [compost metagenome]